MRFRFHAVCVLIRRFKCVINRSRRVIIGYTISCINQPAIHSATNHIIDRFILYCLKIGCNKYIIQSELNESHIGPGS